MDRIEITLEIDAALVEQARAAAVPLATVMEEALKAALSAPPLEDFARVWAEEHAKALDDRQTQRDGPFGGYLRIW